MNEIKSLLDDLTAALWGEYMAMKFYAGQSLEDAMDEYRNELALVMLEYLDSTRPITAFRNQYKRATNDAFEIAFIAGWADGGASGEIPPDLRTWLNGQINSQLVYIDGVFEELKNLRAEGDRDAQSAFVGARADGYSGSLVGVYAYAKMNADKYKIGVWRVGATETHCTTCGSLDGQVRTIQSFLDAGLIPQQKGSATLECGGWQCQCTIQDPVTGRVIIP